MVTSIIQEFRSLLLSFAFNKMNPSPPNPVIRKPHSWCLNHRKCAIAIGIVEIVGAALGVAVYSYASGSFPLLKKYVKLPEAFLSDDIVVGMLNTLAILSVYELILGVTLIEGIISTRLHKVKFWLSSMFAYKSTQCALLMGMMLAGCKSSEINVFFFASVALRSLEMITIYTFLEKEVLNRRRQKIQAIRQASSISSSCDLSNTNVTQVEGEASSESDLQQLLITR